MLLECSVLYVTVTTSSTTIVDWHHLKVSQCIDGVMVLHFCHRKTNMEQEKDLTHCTFGSMQIVLCQGVPKIGTVKKHVTKC